MGGGGDCSYLSTSATNNVSMSQPVTVTLIGPHLHLRSGWGEAAGEQRPAGEARSGQERGREGTGEAMPDFAVWGQRLSFDIIGCHMVGVDQAWYSLGRTRYSIEVKILVVKHHLYID